MTTRNRNKGIYFMVSDEEYAQIQERMSKAEINNLRAYLLKMAIDGYIVQLDLSDVSKLVPLLGNATNNLNQIAKRANENGNIYEDDIAEMQTQINDVWDKTNGILKSLAKF